MEVQILKRDSSSSQKVLSQKKLWFLACLKMEIQRLKEQ